MSEEVLWEDDVGAPQSSSSDPAPSEEMASPGESGRISSATPPPSPRGGARASPPGRPATGTHGEADPVPVTGGESEAETSPRASESAGSAASPQRPRQSDDDFEEVLEGDFHLDLVSRPAADTLFAEERNSRKHLM